MMMSKLLLIELKQFDNGLFKKILADQDFTDVSLVTEDGITISAHRLVLSASSDFFQQVFKRNPNPKTIIYVDNVSHVVLEGLVHFIYTGQVRIEKSGLKSFWIFRYASVTWIQEGSTVVKFLYWMFLKLY